ncbi:TauD/TfdA dioxygenase family protein [Variovorax sp. PBL-E5]|uniref:TauD/TfdA dioxygenase family protein n=1 Tax=Variovorax sp. PBL-E5 TaxID=434014 RepID=UPI001318AA4E|nr:TauD/TfdA family dioxygenase [Variovorax sp. PBL-E5]VTU17448.1 Alpha-ketoglutarate-dependent taurine dioxygenase [Variovorax sp. PBL-E5]
MSVQAMQARDGATAATSAIRVTPTGAAVGARVEGVDLRAGVNPEQLHTIVDALGRFGMLYFPGQDLDDESLMAFSRLFGSELDIHALTQFAKPGHPEIFVLSNIVENGRPLGASDAAQYWHTDLSYSPTPSRVSLLYALKVPQDETGPLGDTEFASTAQAYADLNASTKALVAGRRAFHDAKKVKPRPGSHFTRPLSVDVDQRLQQVSHPIVRTHKDSGAQCLYVNEGFTTAIDGLPPEEGRALLHRLFDHMTQPRYIYRHKWQTHDLVMWDNCLTIHQGIPNYGPHQPRLMNRTIVKGEVPF